MMLLLVIAWCRNVIIYCTCILISYHWNKCFLFHIMASGCRVWKICSYKKFQNLHFHHWRKFLRLCLCISHTSNCIEHAISFICRNKQHSVILFGEVHVLTSVRSGTLSQSVSEWVGGWSLMSYLIMFFSPMTVAHSLWFVCSSLFKIYIRPATSRHEQWLISDWLKVSPVCVISTDARPLKEAYDGPQDEKIVLESLGCHGNETSLEQCPGVKWKYVKCQSNQLVRVHCSSGQYPYRLIRYW